MLKDNFLVYFKDDIFKRSDRTLQKFAEELGWHSSQSLSAILNGRSKFPKDKIKPLFHNFVTEKEHQLIFLRILCEVEKEDYLVNAGIKGHLIKKLLDPNIIKILSKYK